MCRFPFHMAARGTCTKREYIMIDLVSDTVTLPSSAMLDTIRTARLGDAGRLDDAGRGEDIATNQLEDLAAELTGKEAALFYPTGTMANTSAILSHCTPGSTVLVEEQQHIYIVEKICFQQAGFRMHPVLYHIGADGKLDISEFERALEQSDIHLVCLENTHNFSGGTCISPEDMEQVSRLCVEHGVPLHLDGARLFNAAEALQVCPREITAHCDSVMFCISKGLGAPIGSLLCGNAAFINRAREWRKLLGGTMRQSGIAAICGSYALNNNVTRLSEDRKNAQLLAERLSRMEHLRCTSHPQTNILIFDLHDTGITGEDFCNKLEERDIRGCMISEHEVRLVFHMGITAEDASTAAEQILDIDRSLR